MDIVDMIMNSDDSIYIYILFTLVRVVEAGVPFRL